MFSFRNLKKKIIIQIVLLLVSYIYLNGQSICPPESGINCTDWFYGIYNTSTENPDCVLSINYHYRICDGVYQIYIDSLAKTGNCQFLTGENASSFQDWLNLLMIEEISGLYTHPIISECPDSSIKVIFYTATCGLWVKCTFEINEESKVCDEDWRGDIPGYQSGGKMYYDVWKWQNCGLTCCKKTYSICKHTNTSTGAYTIEIKGMTKQKVGDCTNPDGFTKPCQDGC
jgi:hypothetical protein